MKYVFFNIKNDKIKSLKNIWKKYAINFFILLNTINNFKRNYYKTRDIIIDKWVINLLDKSFLKNKWENININI